MTAIPLSVGYLIIHASALPQVQGAGRDVLPGAVMSPLLLEAGAAGDSLAAAMADPYEMTVIMVCHGACPYFPLIIHLRVTASIQTQSMHRGSLIRNVNHVRLLTLASVLCRAAHLTSGVHRALGPHDTQALTGL